MKEQLRLYDVTNLLRPLYFRRHHTRFHVNIKKIMLTKTKGFEIHLVEESIFNNIHIQMYITLEDGRDIYKDTQKLCYAKEIGISTSEGLLLYKPMLRIIKQQINIAYEMKQLGLL